MAGIDIPELYHLAVALDLGISGPVTQEDARRWVEKLMRERVAQLHEQLGEVLTRTGRPEDLKRERQVFGYSFGLQAGDLEEDDDLEEAAEESDDD